MRQKLLWLAPVAAVVLFTSGSEGKPKGSAEGEDKWSDILEGYNPDDSKYKM